MNKYSGSREWYLEAPREITGFILLRSEKITNLKLFSSLFTKEELKMS